MENSVFWCEFQSTYKKNQITGAHFDDLKRRKLWSLISLWNAFEVKYVQRIFDLLSWEKFHRGVPVPKNPLELLFFSQSSQVVTVMQSEVEESTL